MSTRFILDPHTHWKLNAKIEIEQRDELNQAVEEESPNERNGQLQCNIAVRILYVRHVQE